MRSFAKLSTPVSLDDPRKPPADTHDGEPAAYFVDLLSVVAGPTSGW